MYKPFQEAIIVLMQRHEHYSDSEVLVGFAYISEAKKTSQGSNSRSYAKFILFVLWKDFHMFFSK